MKILSNPQALAEVYEEFFKQRNNGDSRKLSKDEFERRKIPNSFAAWRIDLHETKVKALVFLHQDAQFAPPMVVLEKEDSFDTKFLKWPHVEKNDKLCLMQEDNRIFHDYAGHAKLLDELIAEAESLIEQGITGETKQDFVKEIRSYWPNCKTSYISLSCLEDSQTRIIPYYGDTHNTTHIFFDSEKTAKIWINNSKYKTELYGPKKTVIFVLEKAPFPEDYPINGSDLIKFIQTHSSLGEKEIKDLLISVVPDKAPRKLPLLFFIDTGINGIAMLGIMIERRDTIKNRHGNLKEIAYHNATALEKLNRYLDESSILERVVTTRINPGWIYKRGGTSESEKLKNKKVCIIGCGSLGSGVAELLSKSGISNLTLIDPDALEWENIARHSIGAAFTRVAKSDALQYKIAHHFPFSNITAHKKRWQDLTEDEFQELCNVDLIISTTGDWCTEDHLNKLFKFSSDLPPILFAWLEPYAFAGQALLIKKHGACFQCLIDENLRFTNRVIESGEKTKTLDTACGGASSPYGAIEMSFTQSMTAKLAIDYITGQTTSTSNRTWIGDIDKIKDHDLEITAKWAEKLSIPNSDNKIFYAEMPVRHDCPICNGKCK